LVSQGKVDVHVAAHFNDNIQSMVMIN